MPQPTLQVLDATSAPVTVNTINPNGQTTAANSQPVVLATDQSAVPNNLTQIGGTAVALETTDSDGEAPSATGKVLPTEGYPKMFNGSTWDRLRGDTTTGVYGHLKGLAGSTLPTGASLPVLGTQQVIRDYPSAQSLAATGTVQFGVQAGATVAVTVTNAVASTAAFNATVQFQTSPDGSSWSSVNAMPVSSLPGGGAVTVTQTTTAGMWTVNIPTGHWYFRFNVSAWVSGTVWMYIEALGRNNITVQMPWSYTVTSGQTLMPFTDMSGVSELLIRISAVTTTVLTVQGTNDPSGADVVALQVQEANTATSSGAGTITAAGSYRVPVVGWKWVRIQCTTTGTVLTVQGISAKYGQSMTLSSTGNSVTVTATNLSSNMAQVAGQVPLNPVANGSTNRAIVAVQGTAVTQADQSATAFAGSGRVNGTVVAAATGGGGACVSSEINVTALTLGTATAVIPILQESRGGTNFTDIWVGDPITTTGIQSTPAIPVAGRRRWCMHSIGGTSTTVTTTITSLELPAGYVKQVYFRDAYNATNPLATVINSVTQTASTFGAAPALTATTQATSWCVVEGCKQITAQLTLGGGPTVTTQPVISLEVSNDLSNGFVPASGATMTAAGNGTYSCGISGQSWRYARLRVTTAAAYSAGAYTITTASIYGSN